MPSQASENATHEHLPIELHGEAIDLTSVRSGIKGCVQCSGRSAETRTRALIHFRELKLRRLIAKVDGVRLLSLSQINERFTERDPNQQYYLHYKAGVRPLKAVNFYGNRFQTFQVSGGIIAWDEEIDTTAPRC